MNILSKHRRLIIIVLIIISVGVMLFFNVNDLLGPEDYSNRLNIICLIFLSALLFLLFIVFVAYKVVYDEMAERVNTITASKNDLQATYNNISMLLIEVNNEGIIINVNDSVCNYLNRKRNHILGKKISQVLPMEPSAIEKIKQMVVKSFSENIKVSSEFETGGNIFEASVSIPQGQVGLEEKVLLVLNDVTQERTNYKQMMQDNKMIAVGHLAAGVAHEIRNLLGVIRTYSHLLKKQPDDPQIYEKAISMIDYSVDRSSLIIDNLLGFSRMTGDSWETVDLASTIKSILELEEHEFHNRSIKITINCSEDIKLYTIAESIQIILVNLINNAIDAIEENGEVFIDCIETKNEISITVRDTGTGIPEKIKSDIFNPFFTTKSNRNGSGLGLYIVYNEILKLKGKIEVKSTEGIGTSFIVTFFKEKRRTVDE